MKTHLPIALRKALLAAVAAVSAFAYNRAEAATYDVQLPEPSVKTVAEELANISPTDNDSTVAFVEGGAKWSDIKNDVADLSASGPLGTDGAAKVSAVTLETAFDGTNNTIKTDAASVSVEQNIGGSGNKIITGSGNVETSSISGNGTSITTNGGNITTGDISGNGIQLKAEGSGSISVGKLGDNSDNLTLTANSGDVKIASLATTFAFGPTNSNEVDELEVKTDGKLELGLSSGALANADITAKSGITLGGHESGKTEILQIRGMESKVGGTSIETEGKLIVNQSLEVRPGDGNNAAGDVNIFARSGIEFNGATTEIQGGGREANSGNTVIESAGAITFSNKEGVLISDLARVSTIDGSGGNIVIDNEGAQNQISGDLDSDGFVEITGGQNIIWILGEGKTAEVKAEDDIRIEAAGANGMQGDPFNIISQGAIDSTEGDVDIVGGKFADVTSSSVSATKGMVQIKSGAVSVSTSSVTAMEGDITIAGNDTAGDGTGLQDATVKGKTITVGDAGTRTTIGSYSDADTQASFLNASGAIKVEGSSVNVSGNTSIDSETEGVAITASGGDTTVSQSQVEAAGNVTLSAAGNYITDATKLQSHDGNIVLTAPGLNLVEEAARLDVENDGYIYFNGGTTATNVVRHAGTVLTAGGNIDMAGAKNTIYDSAKLESGANVNLVAADADDAALAQNTIDGAEVKAAGSVALKGEANAVLSGSSVKAEADVVMAADTQNAVVNSTVTAVTGSITMGDVAGSTATVQNVVTAAAGKSATLTAGEDVSITGDNIITSTDLRGTCITAETGSITIHDGNYIRNAEITAQDAVLITTGLADRKTWIEDTSLSGNTVTIAGDVTDRSTENLAVVKGSDTEIFSWGDDNGAGITLNNVSVVDTVNDSPNIKAHGGGDIVILNRVDVLKGTLFVESGPSGASSAGRIVVDDDNVLNMTAESRLAGRLSGVGAINKSGGDSLMLDYDHTEFNGTIYANGAVGGPAGSVTDQDNTGSWLEITDTHVAAGEKAGVGDAATIVLKNTNLVVSATEASIGTLDTTQDAERNKAGTSGTLDTATGSYTADDNHRTDFAMVGSVLEVNMDAAGDTVRANNLRLSDATLIKLNAEVAADGTASSDKIEAAGAIDVAARTGLNSTSTATAPSTARVYIRHNDLAATAAEGTRTTIMQGTMVADINEDVLYDVAASGNGTYQRELQDRNVHLENLGDRVDLVYSRNYRSCVKTPQMQQIANALREISDTFHHSEGTLAASPNRLHNLLDAFDYTRSEGAAQRGLQSVAGTGNVLPRLMMFDASRHHLGNLRKQMLMPHCDTLAPKSGEVRRNNVWMTTTGSHDELCGDSFLADYSRSSSGAMLGIDRSVRCDLRVGLSLGYEESTGKSGPVRVEADTFFVDAYAAGVTGRFRHRASVGLATSRFDTDRSVLVEAGYHTFEGRGKGSTDSLTLNFGYEISTDFQLSERSSLTPYAAINLSWHKLDAMREQGMGEAGLVTSYDNEWQSEIIMGVSYNRQFSVMRNLAPAQFYANAAMHLELFNDRVSVSNRFQGAPVSWRAESMNRQPLYFEFGAGVAVPLSPNWTATAGAAYEIGSDRAGVSGNVGVLYSF